MITEYHRPTSIEGALALLARQSPKTVPMGGGTFLSRNNSENIAVVDTQELGLAGVSAQGNSLELGACVTLQSLMDHAAIPACLRQVLRMEQSANSRQRATLAGTIVVATGRSAFLTGLLAMGAQITWLPVVTEVSLGDFLALRSSWRGGKLIRSVKIPTNASLEIETVARTPADQPILCVAVCRWPSGRTRVALGGYGASPILAMDGPEAIGADQSAKNAYSHAGDAWASAEYRSSVAGDLVRRLIEKAQAKRNE